MKSKLLVRLLVGAVLVAAILFLGASWYFSGEIRNGALVVNHSEPDYDLKVVALSDHAITLETTPETSSKGRWNAGGMWGLAWDGGYCQIGTITDLHEDRVERELFPLMGVPEVGQKV